MVVYKNKRGWMKIVEAFVSILLIVGVLLIVINKGYIGKDISSRVYETEQTILRGVQLNDEFRGNILISNKSGYGHSIGESPLPIEWEEFNNEEERILQGVKNKIIEQIPSYLDCKAKIFELDDPCILEETVSGEIYTQTATIVANYAVFSPRQLKLFCWVK